MNPFLQVLYAHPMQSIGAIFAVFAMAGALLFLRGFFSGFGNLFTFDHNDYYLTRARTRVVWGVLILYATFTVWEIVRFVVGWVTETPTMSAGGWEFIIFMWLLYIGFYQFAIKDAK
jgi:hypothetical protein